MHSIGEPNLKCQYNLFLEAGLNVVTHSMSGLKIRNNADINSFVRTHHPRAVVYAELYFPYFIFLTKFSGAASCVAPVPVWQWKIYC